MLTVKKKQKGFTLVEILLVMLITSVLVLGVNAAFRQTHMLWSRTEKQRPVYQKTRRFYDTLQEELVCLYMPKMDDEQAPFTLTTLPDGTIRMSFFSLNPAWKGTALSNLPAKISYEFLTNSDSGQKSLSRTEQLFSGQKAIGSEQKETVLEGFSAIAIQAANPDTSSLADSWKSELSCQELPPKAIKILLKWSREDQTEFEFATTIKISCQGQIVPP